MEVDTNLSGFLGPACIMICISKRFLHLRTYYVHTSRMIVVVLLYIISDGNYEGRVRPGSPLWARCWRERCNTKNTTCIYNKHCL